jgi:site-specific recombinase XerD
MEQTDKTLASAQNKFITYLKNQGKASATILAYGKDIAQLIEFLNKKQITQVTSITTEPINDFKEYLADNKYIAKSISRKLNSIKTFFRFLITEGFITENPAVSVTHPKYEVSLPRILTKLEYRALRDAARNDIRIAAIIELLLQTGVRIGELARIELDDFKDNEIFIREFESHPSRTIPLNEAAKKSLEAYLNIRAKTNAKSIFVTKTGKPLLIRNIRAIVDRYFRVADIQDASINALRHTFIAHQLIGGTSVVLVQKLVGHKRLSTTEKYLEIVKDKVQESVKLEVL